MKKFYQLTSLVLCFSLIFSFTSLASPPPPARLGGGPSESAVWEYNRTIYKSLSASAIDDLADDAYRTITGSNASRDSHIYRIASLVAGLNTGISIFSTFFSTTQTNLLQSSYNEISRIANRNTPYTLKFHEYIRRATGARFVVCVRY